MYNYIKGVVVDTAQNKIVIENNGIGYEISVSGNTLFDVGQVGKTMKVYTYLYVKEDAFLLYGFSKLEEKTLFLKLIDISGVGPKMAMQILGGYDLKTLTVAIATGDSKTLTKIKGLGKKTAELIILNLKDTLADGLTDFEDKSSLTLDNNDITDAVFALEALGISKTEAVKTANLVAKNTKGVENIIAKSLQLLT